MYSSVFKPQISVVTRLNPWLRDSYMQEIQVLNFVEDNEPSLYDHPILREYKYVFLEEIPYLPPRRDIYFSIELVLGAVSMSRAPCIMSTPELIELKL